MHPKEGGGGELRASEGARQRRGGNVLDELRCNEKRLCQVYEYIQDTDTTEWYARFLILTDAYVISGVRYGIKWIVKLLFRL